MHKRLHPPHPKKGDLEINKNYGDTTLTSRAAKVYKCSTF